MKWRIFTVGRPSLAYARVGSEEYLKRMRRYASCEHLIMRSGKPSELEPLLESSKRGMVNIILDERGRAFTTDQFTETVRRWQLEAVKRVNCFFGGADGHPAVIREKGDLVMRLSAFTLQHELALVLFLEQLYRVHKRLRGEPYHR